MNVLDLFSGIGGFSLGLERAGMRTVAFCERDEFCRAVLRKHWPDVPCFEDIHAIDAGGLGRLGRINVVCGGFPCQPFSIAGKQPGKADDRYLWPAMCEVIALARPDYVLGENVAGIITLALDDVLSDLESLGYAARPFVIPACAVGAHHRRDRVWIIARDTHRKGESARAQHAGEVAELPRSIAHAHGPELRNESGGGGGESWQDQTFSQHNGTPGPMADADGKLRRRGHNGEIQDSRLRSQSNERSRGTVSNQGYWNAQPGVDRVANGIPHRAHRLRTLGNAVVPQVVEEIGRAIMRFAHTSKPESTK